MTISSAASDENFIKLTNFHFSAQAAHAVDKSFWINLFKLGDA